MPSQKKSSSNSSVEQHELNVRSSVKQGSYLREMIFGFNDGLVTNFALIAGVAGAISAPSIIILVAIAETFAGAVSMALGTYISSKSQIEFYQSKMKQEERDIENNPELEKEELRKIYLQKGFSDGDLDLIIEKITSDRKRWVKEMVECELQLPTEGFRNPKKAAGIMGVAYIVGSLIPVFPYFFGNTLAFDWMIGISTLALLIVGWVKAKFTERSPIVSALELMAVGLLASVVAYAVGTWVSGLTGLI